MSRIDDYVARLERALSEIGESERREILLETRSHLEAREAQGGLDESLEALGKPEVYARAFLDEAVLRGALARDRPVTTLSALLAVASRRFVGAIGLFVTGMFFLVALGLGVVAVTEIIVPDLSGLWIDEQAGWFAFGIVDASGRPGARDVLGGWVIPVATGLSIVSLTIGQRIGQSFLKLMMERVDERVQ